MAQQSILIVDEDAETRESIRSPLEAEGYYVQEADSEAALMEALAKGPIDLILLEECLSSGTHLNRMSAIKNRHSAFVIVISAKDDVIDRVVSLEMGADDFITKPFVAREVTARIRAMLRRKHEVPETSDDCTDSICITFSDWIVVPDRFELSDTKGNIHILTTGDFKLLLAFLHNPNRVLSRDQLMDAVNGSEWAPLDRTIDNQVARLRKKIEATPTRPEVIKTVRGIGYQFVSKVTRGQRTANAA